jgi:hypothetical protein
MTRAHFMDITEYPGARGTPDPKDGSYPSGINLRFDPWMSKQGF